ncbi:MAG: hypothetical protein ABIT70_03460 [Sulfuriferula sp.]
MTDANSSTPDGTFYPSSCSREKLSNLSSRVIDIDSFDEVSLRFTALDFALDGLYEHAKACQVEPEQVESIILLFRDLRKEYRCALA